MKTTTIFLFFYFILAGSFDAYSQDGRFLNGEKREKVEAMKIAFITKRLDLSPEEAKTFWPVYNQMAKELDVIRKNRRTDIRDAKEDFSAMNDKEVEKLVDNEIIFKQNEVDILKKYHGQFKQVLPVKKVALLYKSEEDFKRYLLNEIRNRTGGRPGNKE